MRIFINISRSSINCDSLNSNYIASSKRFAKDEVRSTKKLSRKDVSKKYFNSKLFNISSRNDQQNLLSNLHWVRIENPSRIIFRQIDIKSIRNKFDLLMTFIKDEIDIFMISEGKTDNSFPIYQFTMIAYSISFRFDWKNHELNCFCLSENIFLVNIYN